eukprot:scaffold120044_cov19-Prasinocladus_malaysianus.AAC.1
MSRVGAVRTMKDTILARTEARRSIAKRTQLREVMSPQLYSQYSRQNRGTRTKLDNEFEDFVAQMWTSF